MRSHTKKNTRHHAPECKLRRVRANDSLVDKYRVLLCSTSCASERATDGADDARRRLSLLPPHKCFMTLMALTCTCHVCSWQEYVGVDESLEVSYMRGDDTVFDFDIGLPTWQ